ncbi:MAG: hypothetical protein AUK44_06060 [Porphyromonadaceae bacterium CG2_30_38_12]|nr:MAG: hypothetical protein AUK44_06060 [Porphyromonadaceae bacterium CG2_30_38_12]
MAFYQFKAQQFIPATLPEVWDFISSPANLKKITPEHMGFDITSRGLPEKMYPGMIISYKVKPVAGIPLTWVTEITHVVENEFFVDEQRIGPYTMWHHEHHIKATANGVMMDDIVSYQPPFGMLGAVANSLLIRRQLQAIFDYRNMALEKKFGKQ